MDQIVVKVKHICVRCGSEFERAKHSERKFCTRECMGAARKKYTSEDERKLYTTYNAYKKRCDDNGLPFELEVSDFTCFEGQECYYCGEIGNVKGYDRVVPEFGYVKSNIVYCCAVCNSMKLIAVQEDFLNRCIMIANNHNKKQRRLL